MNLLNSTTPILFFDGVCNLCNGVVQFVLKHDRREVVKFASLQSDHGEEILKHVQQQNDITPDSIILVYNNKVYTKAGAALRLCYLMGGFWQLFAIFRVVPKFISNAVYDVVAKNRYKWFGKREECMVPLPKYKNRFL